MTTTLLSDVIKKRQGEGLPVDDAAVQRVRDQYMDALRAGKTQTTLLDDTGEEGITWVPKQYDDGRIDWYPSEEPLKEDFLVQDALAGLTANTLAKPSEGGSPFSKLAGLAAMMAGAGKLGGVYKGGRLAGRMAAHGAALGGYSGVGTAMTGGDAGDVLKATGAGAALGAGLTGIAASPLGRSVLTSAPGEAALWAGLEAAHNPDASVAELAGAAGMGMVASRLAGMPYRTRYEPLEPPPAQREVRQLLPAGEPPAPPPPRDPKFTPKKELVEKIRRQKLIEANIGKPNIGRSGDWRPWPTSGEPIELSNATRDAELGLTGLPKTALDAGRPAGSGDLPVPIEHGRRPADRALLGLDEVPLEPIGAKRDIPEVSGVGELTAEKEGMGGQWASSTANREYLDGRAADRARGVYAEIMFNTGDRRAAVDGAVKFYKEATSLLDSVYADELKLRRELGNEPAAPLGRRDRRVKPVVVQPQIGGAQSHGADQAAGGRDVTLGSGLGGLQQYSNYKSVFRPATLPNKPSNSNSPISKAMHTFAKNGKPSEIAPMLSAFRQSPAPSQEFVAGIADIKPVGRHALWAAPRTHVLQALGGGSVNSPVVRETLGHMEEADLVSHKIADIYSARASKYVKDKFGLKQSDSAKMNELMPMLSSADIKVSNADLMRRPEIAKLLGGVRSGRRGRLLSAGKHARVLLDSTRKMANDITGPLGLNDIPYRDNYWPRREASSGLASYMKVPDRGYYTSRREGFKGTPAHHRGDVVDYPVETDFFTIIDRYGHEVAEHVGNQLAVASVQPQIDAIRSAADALEATVIPNTSQMLTGARPKAPSDADIARAKDLRDAADTIENILNLDYQGGKTRIDELSDEVVSAIPKIAVPLRNVMRKMSAMNTKAHLGLRWTLTTQWSSGALVDVRVDARSAAKAREQIMDPVMRAWVRENSYAFKMKDRGAGSVMAQDGSLVRRGIRKRGPLEWFGDIVGKPGKLVEDGLNTYSYLAGFNEGKARGMSDADAMNFADDLVKKTQSMYDRRNRSKPLKSADIVAAFKYQTFQVEMFNMLREMGITDGIFGKTGAYNDAYRPKEPLPDSKIPWKKDPAKWTPLQRAWFVAKLLAQAMLNNEIVGSIAGKDNWKISSLFPYTSNLVGGYGKHGGLPYFAQQTLGVVEALGSVFGGIKNFVDGEGSVGDFMPALDYAVSNTVPMGSDLSRAAKAAIAIDSGEWKGASIDADNPMQSAQAMLFGARAAYEDYSPGKDTPNYWAREMFDTKDTPSPDRQIPRRPGAARRR